MTVRGRSVEGTEASTHPWDALPFSMLQSETREVMWVVLCLERCACILILPLFDYPSGLVNRTEKGEDEIRLPSSGLGKPHTSVCAPGTGWEGGRPQP